MYRNDRISALIPARGGSKGIPEKNLVEFLGQALIVHSIAAAKKAETVDDVVVSTDCDRIAGVAREAGAQVIVRPAEIAHDQATTESAIAHFISNSEEGNAADVVVLLQPTSPLRPQTAVDDAVRTLIDGEYDSLLSVCPTHRFFWHLQGGAAVPDYDIHARPRRQDIRPEDVAYVENGSIYVFTKGHFAATGNRLGGKIGHVIHSERFQLEIDSLADLAALEAVARRTAH